MNQPILRFSEFEDKWKEEKLSNLTQKEKSYSLSRNYENNNGNYNYIHYGDIHTRDDGIITNIDVLPMINGDNYVTLKSGDIVLADASEDYSELAKPFALLNIPNNKVVAGLHTIALSLNNLNLLYFYYYLSTNKFRRFAYVHGTGLKVFGISYDELSKHKMMLPSLTEQTKIGHYFQLLDRVIELQQAKLKHLRKLKNGYLQKMFTNENEPRLRFKGFNDNWTSQLMENVVNRFDNKRVPITESKRIKGTTPYYGANGIQDYVKGYTHNGHFVLIAEDGANSLRDYPIYDVRGKLWINNHAHVIGGKDNKVNTDFLAYRLKTIFLYPYLTGNGRYKLNSNVMMSIKINIPSIQEQKQIGHFFNLLDKQIELANRKLLSLQKTKKAYLQKMFI